MSIHVSLTNEEQLQNFKKWWCKHYAVITICFAVVVLSLSGYKYFMWRQQQLLFNASNFYERLMVAFSNNNDREIKSYSNRIIHNYNKTIYADVSRMTLAKIAMMHKKYDEAYQLLNYIVKNSKLPSFRQIARIRIARILLITKKFADASNELKIIEDASYIGIVEELQGDIYVQLGEYKKAKLLYNKAIQSTQKHGLGNLFLEMKINELGILG